MPIVRLDDRAVVRIAGPDANALLQNVVTLDVDRVDSHGSGYGALLTPQGKILWDFVLHRIADGYVADLRADQVEAFVKRLSFYRLRAKVEIAAAPDKAVFAEWPAQGQAEHGGGETSFSQGEKVAGEQPDEGMRRRRLRFLIDAASPDPSPSATPSPFGRGVPPSPPSAVPAARFAGERRALADPRLAELGGRWIAEAGSVTSDAAAADWHRRRIALAVPEGGVDFVFGDTFPHDAAMDSLNGVAFEKGCYIGQEVVSRMRHRASARRRVVAVHAAAPLPDPGAEVSAGGTPLGRLGSSADGNGIAIVRLDRTRAALDAGTPIRVGGEDVRLELPVWATYGWPAVATAAED